MKLPTLSAVAFLAALLIAPASSAQEPPEPGPELDVLKKMEGKWDTVMKVAGAESKGTYTSKMGVGGMWLVGDMEGELFGAKFVGKSLESYDAAKKKYVSIWVDSRAGAAVMMEGTHDKEKQTMTLAGEGPGMDGKPTKYRSVTTMKDDDSIEMTMYTGDAKEPTFTIAYKRKK